MATFELNAVGGSSPMFRAFALAFLPCSGCGHPLEDNGTHLAYAMEKGAAQLRESNAFEHIVHFDTLDKANQPYYVEITPS